MAPISVSYKAVTQCFSELEDEKLKIKVDLNLLKALIDKKYVSQRSLLVERVAIFTDSSKIKKKLRYWTDAKPEALRPSYQLQLDFYDEHGMTHEQILPDDIKLNPKAKDIAAFFATASFESDRSIWVDVKINSARLTYKVNMDKVEDLRFWDIKKKRELACDQREGGVILCDCVKK